MLYIHDSIIQFKWQTCKWVNHVPIVEGIQHFSTVIVCFIINLQVATE